MPKIHYQFQTSRRLLPSTFETREKANEWLARQHPSLAQTLTLVKVTTTITIQEAA